MFEYLPRSLQKVLEYRSNRQELVSEAILLKILKNGFEALVSCKGTNTFYPEMEMDRFFVQESGGAGRVGNEPRGWGFVKKEVKLMHPFLFRSFLGQLNEKLHRDLSKKGRLWVLGFIKAKF